MSRPAWLVRTARKTDRALLESFCCADMAIAWQAEVQTFIRQQLFDWAFDPLAKEQDPRLLLLFERKNKALVGVGAHERTTMRYAGRPPFAATKLEVVAVARAFQGRTFATGERVSDVVMSSIMSDVIARVPPRAARIFAVVHEDNERSIALCRRHGLTEELSRPHPAYRRLVTP